MQVFISNFKWTITVKVESKNSWVQIFSYKMKNNFHLKKIILEAPGIDPGTSRMLSERSTIWATPPSYLLSNFLVTNF